jgi:NAD(P)-dependent dehydrogenase (short-subunit alcohol dehydrogenase family)
MGRLESTGIKVNAACPGFTATDLNNFQGTRTVQQAAREPVRLALLDANGPTGTFSNEEGRSRGDAVSNAGACF